MEDATEEQYHEMKRHLPILWTVMKYLRANDLLQARLIDRYWKDAIEDTLPLQEWIGVSPLTPITLSSSQMLQEFEAAFPAPNEFRPFHFANFKLSLEAVSFPEFGRFMQVYCPHIKFATIGVPDSSTGALLHLKVFLNNCRVLQKLYLENDWSRSGIDALPEILEPAVIAPLPSLQRIDINCERSTWVDFVEFLEDLVQAAPNLRTTSVRYSDNPSAGIPAVLKALESTLMLKLELCFELRTNDNGQQLFRELVGMNLKVRELSLLIFQWDPEDQVNGFGDWLAKLDNAGLQNLSMESGNFLVSLPAVLNIRRMKINTDFARPLEPSQVPNLEDLTILRAYTYNRQFPNMTLPDAFAAGKAFESVKKLQLHLVFGFATCQLGCAFPNVESLELWRVSPGMSAEDVTAMRTFLQFPNLTRLLIAFRAVYLEYEPEQSEEAWWDLFTGGILPRMNRSTTLEEMRTETAPSTTQDQNGNEIPVPSLFDLLPSKSESWNSIAKNYEMK